MCLSRQVYVCEADLLACDVVTCILHEFFHEGNIDAVEVQDTAWRMTLLALSTNTRLADIHDHSPYDRLTGAVTTRTRTTMRTDAMV